MDIEPAGAAFIRPGQLLTDRGALSAASRWTQAVSEADGVCVIQLTAGADVCELARDLREQGFRASPNHVLAAQPLFFGGPASRPFPVPRVHHRPGRDHSPVVVGLLDTPVAPHPWWTGSDWFREVDEEVPPGEQAGHGTFLAGILARRAPGVSLTVRGVLDGQGLGDEAGVVRALHRMREDPPQVLNLSFGGHTFDDRPPPLLADALGALPDTVTVAEAARERPVREAAARVLAPEGARQIADLGVLVPSSL